jgi:hypothetical protein
MLTLGNELIALRRGLDAIRQNYASQFAAGNK